MVDNIATWFNEQPAWIRNAVETYIKTGEITESKIRELAEVCLLEAKGEDCSNYKVSESNLLSRTTGSSFAIKQISGIKGVNAIDTDKPMVFSRTGMNVIYGTNGSGKSGYIRIFKMISGATYREEIKANIYKSNKIAPECTITVEEDGKPTQQLQCNLKNPGEHEILKRIDIFDTKTAQGYVNEAKEAAFEPWIFRLFSVLAESASKVKKELSDRKDKICLNSFDIPQQMQDADIVKKLKKLSFESKIEDFVKDFTKKDEELLVELKDKLQIEKNEISLKLKNGQIASLTEILDYFKQYEILYAETSFKKINALAEDWMSKMEAYKLSQELLDKNIDDIDKKSRDIDAWKELWRYARDLFDSIKTDKHHDFTDCDGVCPLCHHIITAEESVRMKSIDEYVNGAASISEQKAKKKYKNSIVHPQTKKTENLLIKAGEYRDEFERLITEINSILIENESEVNDFSDSVILLKSVDLEKIIKPLSSRISVLKNDVKKLLELNEIEDQKRILEAIALLEAKKAVKDNESKIYDNIQKLKEKHLYDDAIKKTATNKLTSKSTELAKELITDAYIDRFNEELKKLSASGLTAQIVQGRGRAGKNPYKVQLYDSEGKYVSPKDILSEGESRAVALAAFFAEAAGRAEACPLIIDDPISSLDYEYESRVIARLVEASQSRQVIVFTHRISVVVGISENITNKDLFHELSLKATKDRKGIPGEPDVNASKSDKLLNKLINDNLSKLKKMDELSEEYSREKHYICQQFRNCVEKSVEEFLIGEVVMRFRKDVQTKRIKYLYTITKEDCDIVDDMMTKYSAYNHSMSSETPLIEFDVSEIEGDMNKFSQWQKERKTLVK